MIHIYDFYDKIMSNSGVYFYFKYLAMSTQLSKNKKFVNEIKAFAKLTGLDFSLIYVMNYSYEVSTLCTSTVVRTKTSLIHGRNLDYAVLDKSKHLQNLMFEGHF